VNETPKFFEEILQSYFNGLKSSTSKESAIIILEYLSNHREQHIGEEQWVRSKKLYEDLNTKITHKNQITRSLERLIEHGLIEKKILPMDTRERGKLPVGYRIPFSFPTFLLYDREKLLKFIIYFQDYSRFLLERLIAIESLYEKPINEKLIESIIKNNRDRGVSYLFFELRQKNRPLEEKFEEYGLTQLDLKNFFETV